jgi:GT2 family glycosyltransferase
MSRDALPCDGHRLAAVIVHFATPGQTAACVAALARSRRSVDHVVVVDNGSGDRSLRERLAAWGARRLARRRTIAGGNGNPSRVPISEKLDWIEAPHNLGFAGGANLGVARALDAGASRVFLLNSDALVEPDCLGLLESAVEQPGVGLAGPAIVSARDPATLESTGIAYAPLTGRMRLSGWGQPLPAADSPANPVDALSGCALMIRREVFDRVGLLPEEYFFGFEDLAFCLRARNAGFIALCAPAARVLHQGGASLAPGSPDRIYFAIRNHLLLARRARPLPAPLSALRAAHILALNLAYLALHAKVPRLAGARALASGFADYCAGRSGARSTAGAAPASRST